MQYELFYLVGERQEANLDKAKEGVNAILTAEKATLLEPELSEKRKLAYEIKHQRKGTYVTRRFELPDVDSLENEQSQAEDKEFGIEAITKKLNLFNDVLRFLIVKTEDLPDLGAKDRRKAQEMTTQKQTFQRPQRQERSNGQFVPQMKRPMQPKPQPQPVVEKKEEVKDIDKQLDKLLDI